MARPHGMHRRSITLLTVLVLAGCERSQKTLNVAQTGRSAAAPAMGPTDSAHAANVSEARKVLDWESWIPQWQIAFRHPDTIPVILGAPLERCAQEGKGPLDMLSEAPSHSGSMRLQPTNLPFDAIAVAHGFVRRGAGWATIGTDGTVVEASGDSDSGWKILRGGWYGKRSPPAPISNGDPAVQNLFRHSTMFAVQSHPAGCTIVATYLPSGNGGDDTAAVRHILESVVVGIDSPPAFAYALDSASSDTSADPRGGATGSAAEYPDPGLGVVGWEDTLSTKDTITIHSTPASSSPVVARFIDRADSGYKVIAGDSVRESLMEYAYEIEGLAALDVNRGTSWVQVRYGVRSGKPLTGWTRPIPGRVFFKSWAALTLERGGGISGTGAVTYLASPGGRVLERERVAGGGYAALYPVASSGPWMLVRVVRPSNECDVQAEHSFETYAWVRFLDDRGRPYLWYAPRGC